MSLLAQLNEPTFYFVCICTAILLPMAIAYTATVIGLTLVHAIKGKPLIAAAYDIIKHS